MTLKNAALGRTVLAVLMVLGACDSANHPFNPNNDIGMNNPNGDGPITPAGEDLANIDGPTLTTLDLSSDADGPTITITSPAQGATPVEVQYDTLTVTATITGKNNAFIDGNTVQLLIPASGTTGFSTVGMSLTSVANVYSGSIDISGIRSGPAQFTVNASDVNGKHSTAVGNYVHDHGPVITFVQPTRATARGSLYVEALIDDELHPLTDASAVTATVRAGDHLTLTQIAGAVPLRVQGTVVFSDYSPALDGTQLLIVTATNDHGTIGRGNKQFTVDNQGPLIDITQPGAGLFIGGVIEIQATITDISGVNDTSVVAVFGGDLSKSAPMTRVSGDAFSGLFDVQQLGTHYVLPTLSVRADDQLGNHSEVAEEIVVDNVPPFMSLDPPHMWTATIATGNIVECSQPFDPVGEEAANDLDTVLQVFTLRARVEDRGNFAPGLLVERVSTVDINSVKLIGIPAANGPLAVDTDGDGICDDANPLLTPTTNITASNQAIAVQLASIDPGGKANPVPSPTPTPIPASCTQFGIPGQTAPLPLCLGSRTQMTIAVGYTDANLPAIWTIPPVASNDANSSNCVGLQFDSLNMPEGPACFVVVARDKAGNHSVSPPLRVCVDHGGGLCPVGWTVPNCRGTYDKATMMVNSTACSPAPAFGPDDIYVTK